MQALKYWQYLCQPAVRACIKVLTEHSHMLQSDIILNLVFYSSTLSMSPAPVYCKLNFMFIF